MNHRGVWRPAPGFARSANKLCHSDQELSKSQRTSKSHQRVKSYGHFTEGVDFDYWWSCIRKGLCLQPVQQACLETFPYWILVFLHNNKPVLFQEYRTDTSNKRNNRGRKVLFVCHTSQLFAQIGCGVHYLACRAWMIYFIFYDLLSWIILYNIHFINLSSLPWWLKTIFIRQFTLHIVFWGWNKI